MTRQKNYFVWKEDIAAPSERIPPYRKPTKNPQEATEKSAKDISEKPLEKASQETAQIQESTKKQETKTINIMLDGKIPELSIKFTQKPELPGEGRTVNLQIVGENGIVVKATLARKTLARQIEKMDGYDDWVAVLSGKMVAIAPDGVVELEGAGINVFEKKAKAIEQETE